MPPARFLRPAFIVASGSAVWLVDESLPAAAVVDDRQMRLVEWDDPAPDTELGPRLMVPDGAGIVVQDGDTVTWVGLDGATATTESDGLVLTAADRDAAWLVDRGTPGYVEPESGDRYPGAEAGRIVAVRPDGRRTVIETSRPARRVAIDGADLLVRFAGEPVAVQGAGRWHTVDHPTSTMSAWRSDALDHGVLRASSRPDDPALRMDRLRPSSGGPDGFRPVWLDSGPDVVGRLGVHVGGLAWSVGAAADGDRINRHALIRGYDPDTGTAAVQLDAGPGLVMAVAAVGDEVWMAIARQRYLAVAKSQGVEVVAVEATGALRTVLAPDVVALAASVPALATRPPEAEIEAQVEELRSQFADLENYWTRPDGTTQPFVRGMHDPSVAVEGDWPETRIVVSFHHPARPGLRLRRAFEVFDERGRPHGQENVAIFYIEDLDTGYIAPADEAVNGILDT